MRIEQSDNSLVVEIAQNVQVKVVRGTIADLLNKPVPAIGQRQQGGPGAALGGLLGTGGFLGKLLGKK